MCELLIKAIVNYVHPDPEKDRTGVYQRGDLVLTMEDGHEWGSEEGLPKFVILKIPGVPKGELKEDVKSWYRRIQYTVVGSDLSIDGYRIKIEATEFHTGTGEGKITRTMVENFLNNWGASVFSVDDNAVTFDVKIIDAIKSDGFWHGEKQYLGISEINYDQSTGIHTIRVDYSGLPGLTPEKKEQVKRWITDRFENIIHDPVDNVFTGDIERSIVRNEFQDDVKEKAEKIIVRRKFRLPNSVMNTIETNGGIYTATKLQYLNYVLNKMTE